MVGKVLSCKWLGRELPVHPKHFSTKTRHTTAPFSSGYSSSIRLNARFFSPMNAAGDIYGVLQCLTCMWHLWYDTDLHEGRKKHRVPIRKNRGLAQHFTQQGRVYQCCDNVAPWNVAGQSFHSNKNCTRNISENTVDDFPVAALEFSSNVVKFYMTAGISIAYSTSCVFEILSKPFRLGLQRQGPKQNDVLKFVKKNHIQNEPVSSSPRHLCKMSAQIFEHRTDQDRYAEDDKNYRPTPILYSN